MKKMMILLRRRMILQIKSETILKMSRYEIITPNKNAVLSLQTKRLVLSVYKPSAALVVADYLIRNRDFHKKYSQRQKEKYFTEKEQKSYLKFDLKQFRENTQVGFWIATIDDPNRIIGRLSFYSLIGGCMNSCYVGYHLDQQEQGKGYMKEALLAGCDFMFKYYRLHRIEADILPTNERSIACVTSCGFAKMGYNVRFMEIDGRYQDHVMFVKLNPEVENVT